MKTVTIEEFGKIFELALKKANYADNFKLTEQEKAGVMPTTKTYTLLSEIPHVKIVNCSAMLPNHLQCWRAGDFQVTETTVQPAVAATKDTAAVEEKVSLTKYQLCRFHQSLEAPQS